MDHEILRTEGKRVLKAGYWVLVILGIFLLFEALLAFKAWRNPDVAANTISVVGTGESINVPDVSTFSFSVTTDAKTVAEAQAGVTEKVNTILPGLKDLGIEDKDIKTTDYSIYPKYSYVQPPCTNGICHPSKQTTDGYTVTESILIKVRKTDDAGKALALVGSKGATNVSGLTFTMDDSYKAINDARALAIDDAKAKAEVLAGHLGVKLVRVVGYFDNQSSPQPMYAEGAMTAKSFDSVAPILPVGQNKTTSTVTINYEIR